MVFLIKFFALIVSAFSVRWGPVSFSLLKRDWIISVTVLIFSSNIIA